MGAVCRKLLLLAALAAARVESVRAAGWDDPASQAEMDRCAAAAFEAADAALNRVHGEILACLRGDAATGSGRSRALAWKEAASGRSS